MRRVLSCVLAALLLCSAAIAEEIDLSGLTFDQLVALRDRLNLAIWQSREWQEVTVPQGIWKVGEDIPAGDWTVCCAVDFTAVIEYGGLNETGNGIDFKAQKGKATICSPKYRHYEKGVDLVEYSFSVSEGDYIGIWNCDVIFMPYSGKPDLGFK